ncbi:MAG: GIY-YIG nuclease family protein [Deltaproteobacteria bacterium]|nr:MAG: GIY-YIG nuclease family protein [Deltaproteobacteria bacterium]
MSDADRRRALKQAWKDRPLPAGAYRIRNTQTGEAFFGCSADVPGALNRHRFTLGHGTHRSRALQTAWNAHGPDVFAFETLELLGDTDAPDFDLAEALELLELLWMDRLTPADLAYNAGGRPATRR